MEFSANDDFRWLMSDSAADLLRQTTMDFENQANVLTIAKRLRKSTNPVRAALVIEQVQLRIRGREKFPHADKMFFTRRGLEQSTGLDIAVYKASQLAGHCRVADVCCGLGGDLIALAMRQSSDLSNQESTVGVDSDGVTAMFAARNLEAHLVESQHTSDLSNRTNGVQQSTFEQLSLDEFDAIHLDPDRRTERRTVHGNQFSPSLRDVYCNARLNQTVVIKVAPATPTEDYFPDEIHREWVGDRRECKQQLLWSGNGCSEITSRFGYRTATMVDRGKVHQFSAREDGFELASEIAEDVQEFLYEPHATILAARLTHELAQALELKRACSAVPYLFSDDYINHPLLAAFKVVDVMRVNQKEIEDGLNKFGIGTVEWKQRGIDKMTFSRFSTIKGKGDLPGTVILTRVGSGAKRKAILARRIEAR